MWSSTFQGVVRTCRTRTEQRYCSVRVRFEQSRTRISMFENLPNTNRTRTLFGSVRYGAELEQTEHDLENVRFGLFARLAIFEWANLKQYGTVFEYVSVDRKSVV